MELLHRYLLWLATAAVLAVLPGCTTWESTAPAADPMMSRHHALERRVAALQNQVRANQQEAAMLRTSMRNLQENQARIMGEVGELQAHVRDRAAQVQELRSLVASLEQRLQTQDASWKERMERLRGSLEKDHQRAMDDMAESVAQEIANTVRQVQQSSGGGGYLEHVVQSGDTLSAIAQAYGVTVDAIKQANSLSTDLIRVGQTLKIPAR